MATKPKPSTDAPRYRVLTDVCTLGGVGDVVEVPEGVHVESLIDAGHLEPVEKQAAKEQTNGS